MAGHLDRKELVTRTKGEGPGVGVEGNGDE